MIPQSHTFIDVYKNVILYLSFPRKYNTINSKLNAKN